MNVQEACKIWTKFPTVLEKNVRKPQGDFLGGGIFLTRTVQTMLPFSTWYESSSDGTSSPGYE